MALGVFCFSAPCISKENAANPTLCSGRTGLRRDRKASAWQGLQAGPRPTAAPFPGRLGVPGSSRRHPSCQCTACTSRCLPHHHMAPSLAPDWAPRPARRRSGSQRSQWGAGNPEEPAARLRERDSASRGPQPNLSKRTRKPTGGLSHSLRDSPRVTPRTLGSAHEVAAARTRLRPPPRSHRRQH